jgi:exodeoxyribonuclease VII large subunit
MDVDRTVLTVTDLTRQIKSMLESGFAKVTVEGEISNFKQHTSGHLYFTLKDEGAQLSAVMWRSRVQYLTFSPEDGMKVSARGAITVYPPRGNYQIDVENLKPAGIGELQMAFERLKKKLAAEGLFDPGRKRQVPEFPERIGIITSETGAALKDIFSVISRRQPSVDIIFIPVRVQGEGAAEEIAEAIGRMNLLNADVMIVGRGGGSLEDLWAFNEENVARAIYSSRIPVISAVGHETDFSIADFVADMRAPTPSAAAEMAVRDRTELIEEIGNLYYTMQNMVNNRISGLKERVAGLVSSYTFNRPRDLLREYLQHADELDRGLEISQKHLLEVRDGKLNSLRSRLLALNPGSILRRGYAIVRKDSRVVARAAPLAKGDRADVQFHDGVIGVEVREKN